MLKHWKLCLLLLCLLLVAGAACAIPWLLDRALIGPEYHFVVNQPPAFLTEELAIPFAREVLARDGLDCADWHLYPSGRTSAPDGRRDEFFSRNALNPNEGCLRFNGTSPRTRFVRVQLVGHRLVCQGSWGK